MTLATPAPGGATLVPAREKGAWLTQRRDGTQMELQFHGAWTTAHVGPSSAELEAVTPTGLQSATIDLGALKAIDTAGAWLILQTMDRLRSGGVEVTLRNAQPGVSGLIDTLANRAQHEHMAPAPRESVLVTFLIRIGKNFIGRCQDASGLLSFLGFTVSSLARLLVTPWRIRWRSVTVQMEVAGINALPIVGLISFLIGIVLAFQGAVQLEKFGAQIFTINIVGVGVLREMAIMLTAIVVAGRSGSAFTAQIGTMTVNEEVDALRTIGLDPMEVLVIPRVIGLVLVMPLLTFYANIMGLLGGALQATTALDMTIYQFVSYLQTAVTLNDFMVGMVKAPLFGFIIAMVGCYEGMRVSRSAESVGLHTTRSVVEAIFIVIVLDAALSVFFATVGI